MKEFKSETGAVVTFPENWGEVRFDQFLAITPYEKAKTRFYLEALASDVTALHGLDAGALAEMIETISFIKSKPRLRELTKSRSVGGFAAPEDVSLCPLIQFWCVEEWVEERIDDGYPDDETTWYLPLLAVYLCKSITGEVFTDLTQAEAIINRVNALPCLEAVPLARFFFRKYNTLEPTGRISSQSRSLSPQPSKWHAIRFPNWRTLLARLKSNKSASVAD